MTQIPAGWYPDPAPAQPGQPPLVRYWDGAVWTEHVSPATPQAAPQAPTQPAYVAAPAAPSGPTTPDGQPLAGWWWRVLAYIIDGFIISVAANILSLPAQLSFQDDLTDVMEDFQATVDANPDNVDVSGFLDSIVEVFRDHAFWLFVPTLVFTVLYYGGMLWWRGATLGKMAVGLQVRLRDRPGRLPVEAVIARVIVQFLLPYTLMVVALLSGSFALAGLLLLIYSAYGLLDHLWPLWDKKRQAWHDKAARTNVVKIR
ncbi:MAG TPA: RDD family protein [Nocardioidaceae bacterium]|nr:RDD family protein [Nocardioidaceae bacterium]